MLAKPRLKVSKTQFKISQNPLGSKGDVSRKQIVAKTYLAVSKKKKKKTSSNLAKTQFGVNQ